MTPLLQNYPIVNRNKRAQEDENNQLQAAQVTAHAIPTTCCFTCLPQHCREVSHPRSFPPQAAAHAIPHGKAALLQDITWPWFDSPTLQWKYFLTLPSTNSGTSTWALCAPPAPGDSHIFPAEGGKEYLTQKAAASPLHPDLLLFYSETCTAGITYCKWVQLIESPTGKLHLPFW